MLWLVVVRNLKQCGDQVQNDHKSAQDQLKKAEQCFELGDEGRELADTLHESAAKQLDMAAKQLSIGTEQHIQANKLAEQAVKSDDLGRKLQANAVEIEGNTQIVPRHQRSGPSSTR